MKNVIRIDDTTSHGGVVKTGAVKFMVDGRPVARVGDTCTCPEDGHDDCTIVEGDPNFVIEGRAVAFDGHKTSCGATLKSSATNFGGA